MELLLSNLAPVSHAALTMRQGMGSPLAMVWPLQFERFPGWMGCVLFAALALPIVLLGMRSLNGLGPVRKWVAIGVRLVVLVLFVLILGSAQWVRQVKDLQVLILRDNSESTTLVSRYPGKTLQLSLDDFFRELAQGPDKKPDDTIGVIGFADKPVMEAVPDRVLNLDTRGISQMHGGTNIALAIQNALATMTRDSMHRIVLVTDGNATTGDLDAALQQATAQHVPIDTLALDYNVKNETMVEGMDAPSWKRQNEPFDLHVRVRSTNDKPVEALLSIEHRTDTVEDLDMDLSKPGLQKTRQYTLKPGINNITVRVPALNSGGVHRFHAKIADLNGNALPGVGVDSQGGNGLQLDDKTADAFTYVHGTERLLYINNFHTGSTVDPDAGPLDETFYHALVNQISRGDGTDNKPDINVVEKSVDDFPSLVELQNYDAVILDNVPRGSGGLDSQQDKALAQYVHDMGGGLIMLGGDQTFGAGGWLGSEVEKILPVNMEVPAERQIGQGALVLIMHSCEMPDGNYWGTQCALQAVSALSSGDEIGVISYGWNKGGQGIGGAQWDFALARKGDGSAVNAAIKSMQLGDMPSFDDAMNLALNGAGGTKGLKDSKALYKHVIIISDGDPAAPFPKLIQDYQAAKVSASTVTVYPHTNGNTRNAPQTMQDIADALKGRAYPPINDKFNQLPQIFIKEARIVQRSLIQENSDGVAVKMVDASDDLIRGIGKFDPLFGQVLVMRKPDPKVLMPLTTGKLNDPILAHWQSGRGHVAVFTSDVHAKWGKAWVASSYYDKVWEQIIRATARPVMSSDFDASTKVDGTHGTVTLTAVDPDGSPREFLNVDATVIGPDNKPLPEPLHLVQIKSGVYQAQFNAADTGTYVLGINYSGPGTKPGMLISGTSVDTSPELRDLRTNQAILEKIRRETGGRELSLWDAAADPIFSRDGIRVTSAPQPIWDILIPLLVLLILVDVTVRRVAWDWQTVVRLTRATTAYVRGFTTFTKPQGKATLDALKRKREELAETKFKPQESRGAVPPPIGPDPRARFEATGQVEGDITKVVGGATNQPLPPAPKKIEPKGSAAPTSHTGSLLEAKRRAQQQIKQKEQGDKPRE